MTTPTPPLPAAPPPTGNPREPPTPQAAPRGMKAGRAKVRGRVQGVSFRASTRAEAERLGVRGWVKNLPDGRVELVAEGEPSAVDALVDWARRGPPGARVDGVELGEEPATGRFASFEIEP